ncbi:hypothetical protein RND71_039722 [Anisodus tanguticus]|uniref:Uncharacterized protein n=1 Tax=Anisodus tanguticus TaxID=243964 RepID=A0AAE1QXP7_9SOLA|nr:hypothetical protein RND71_039722 [Anisodus tanguticus]
MGRQLDEVVDYPDYFRHSLKRRLESRQKLLMRKNISCTLSEMLDCNQKKFLFKFGLKQNQSENASRSLFTSAKVSRRTGFFCKILAKQEGHAKLLKSDRESKVP